MRRVAGKCKKTAGIDCACQQRHDVAQSAETRIRNVVFVQVGAVGLPKRRDVVAAAAGVFGVAVGFVHNGRTVREACSRTAFYSENNLGANFTSF